MHTTHPQPAEPTHSRRPRGRIAAAAAATVMMIALPAGSSGADAPFNEPRPVDVSDRIEALDIGCEGHLRGDAAAIRCRWTVPKHPEAVGVKLIRLAVGTDTGRTTVFRTDDLSENTFLDRPVRVGVRYLYAVRAVDADGHIVGASRPVSVGVRPEDTDVEPLRLDCRQISGIRISCEWSEPTVPGRVLTLWRSVDGAVRERVSSFSNPFPTTYVDGVPNGTSTVAYAVIVTDGAGEIVARSRADVVRLRAMDEPPATAPADPAPPAPVDSRPTTAVESIDPRSDETRPTETRSPDTRVDETRPVDSQPTDTRPTDTRPTDTRPTDTRPVDSQPTDTRPTDTRPTDTRPTERSESEVDVADRTDRTERTRD